MDLLATMLTPLLIFLARMIDVSMGTVRILFISRNLRGWATLIGFLEILVWLVAISQIMQNLNHWFNYIAYAGGFAMGNFVGMTIESKLAMGKILVRVVLTGNPADFMTHLKTGGFGATYFNAYGSEGPVTVLLIVSARKDFARLEKSIHQYHPKSFYTVEDVRLAKEGIFRAVGGEESLLKKFRWSRKGI